MEAAGSNGPSGREWGNLTREVQEIRHDLRNLKMIADATQVQLQSIELRTNALNTKIYTTISVSVVIFGVVGFGIQTLISAMK